MSLIRQPRRLLYSVAVCGLSFLIVLGVFARNDWFPRTDGLSGKKYGWFGNELARNVGSTWNPLAAPLPTATPAQLSKEYIYAGSRLLAVEDANANAAPPADLAVWRPTTGVWYVLGGVQGSQQTTYQWGGGSDKEAPGDYDGDGKTDFAIYRPSTGTWYIVNSSDGSFWYPVYGGLDDVPAPADFDGDGKTDLVLYRDTTTEHRFYITKSSGGTLGFDLGSSDDEAAPADFDGDGKADIAVWRASNNTLYVIYSTDGSPHETVVGSNGGKAVPADYDGDGKADCASFNAGTWTIKLGCTGSGATYSYGQSGDKPVPNDYDGDGKCDRAIWRPLDGYWWIYQSSFITNPDRVVQWGMNGDIPVPAFYRR